MSKSGHYDLLCCPACRGDLDVHIEDERLRCGACQFEFPIIQGIPVLFPCNVVERMDELFGRYWDTEEKAELYDTKVEGDDDVFGTYNHESEVYALVQGYEPSNLDVVLDAGCGNGWFLDTFPSNAVTVGIDASLNLLQLVKKRGRGDFLVCGELEHLPFKDDAFGTVITCRVLQHLHQQEAAVLEMSRVTREHGNVILELYNTWNLKTIYKEIRMSPRLRKALNAPFRLVFRSMSPFGDWNLDYDNYNSWFEVKPWLTFAERVDHRILEVGTSPPGDEPVGLAVPALLLEERRDHLGQSRLHIHDGPVLVEDQRLDLALQDSRMHHSTRVYPPVRPDSLLANRLHEIPAIRPRRLRRCVSRG